MKTIMEILEEFQLKMKPFESQPEGAYERFLEFMDKKKEKAKQDLKALIMECVPAKVNYEEGDSDWRRVRNETIDEMQSKIEELFDPNRCQKKEEKL